MSKKYMFKPYHGKKLDEIAILMEYEDSYHDYEPIAFNLGCWVGSSTVVLFKKKETAFTSEERIEK